MTRLEKRELSGLSAWVSGVDAPLIVKTGLGLFAKLPVASMQPERNRLNELFGCRVKYDDRKVPGRKLTTSMPVSIAFSGFKDLMGCISSDRLNLIELRFERLMREVGTLEATLKIAQRILLLEDDDFTSFLNFIIWRRDHPDDRPFIRSLFLAQTDGKWLERNIRLCRAACVDLGQEIASENDIEACGLWREDRREVHISWNGDAFPSPFGNTSMTVRISQINARLSEMQEIRKILIVENLEILEKIRPARDVLVVFGAGHAVGPILSEMAMPINAQLIYWGDVDSHGFSCLSEARKSCPDLTSFRMGPDVMADSKSRMVTEPPESRLNDVPSGLLADEAELCAALKGSWLRLEQEQDMQGFIQLSRAGLSIA